MFEKNELKKHQTIQLILMCAAGLLFVVNSIMDIVFSDTIYSSTDLYHSFFPNDFVNLFLGIPFLILSVILIFRKTQTGLIVPGGFLLFIFYNTIAYLFAVRNAFSLAINTLIAVICIIELLLFVFSINYIYITTKPPYIRRPWVYGMILTAMGLLFIVRALINIIYYTWGRVDLSLPEIGVNIADLVISVFWIISGILLLVKKRKFHIIGILSYFHGSLLFVALIIFMAIQPLLCGTELIITDLFVIGFMSLLFIIPCILLLRKITDPETSRP